MPQDAQLDVILRLDKAEKQIKALFNKTAYVNVSINPKSIVQSRRLLQTALDATPIRLTNISIARGFATGLRNSLQSELDRGKPITINKLALSKGAAAQFVAQVRQAIGSANLVMPQQRAGGRGNSGGRGGKAGGVGSTLPLGKISGDTTEFRKSLDAANARVLAFGASAGAIYLVVRGMKDLVVSTVEVDKALREINVLLNLTDSNLAKFGGEIFNIAKNTATSFQVASAAALEFSRQGLSVEETLSRTAAALNLTRLSGLDSVKSVEALTTALNSFIKEGLTAAEVADKLAAVDAVAATSAGGLAEGVSRVGSAAADAGVSFDELLGLIASAKQITGRSEAVIGNAFKTIFTRLDRSKVRDVLGGVVDIGEDDSAIQILQKLAGAYDGLSRQQQAYVAEITAGVFQINQFKAIISDLSSEFSVFGITQDAITKSTGVADKRVKELTQSLSDLSQIAGTNIQQTFAKIGDIAFKDQASDFLKTFNSIFDQINQIDGESSGAQLGKNFIEGLTNFVIGPGAFLVTAIGAKLVRNLGGQGKTAIKEVLGTDIKAQQQVALEKQINALLEQRKVIQTSTNKSILNTSAITQDIIADIEKQNVKYQNQLDLVRRITTEAQKRGVRLGAGDLPLTGKDKPPSRLSRIGKDIADPFNLALIASIGGEAASGLFDQDSKEGRGKSAIVSGIGKVGSFAAIGSLLGPKGAALGALVGVAASLSDVITSFTSDIPDIQKKLDKASADFTTFSSLSQSVLSLQSNVDNLSKEVATGQATQANLNKAQLRLVSEIARLPEQIRKQYQEAGTLSPQKAFEERSTLLNQEASRKQGLLAAQGNNLNLASILDKNTLNLFYGKLLNPTSGETIGKALSRSAGLRIEETDYNAEQDSRLRESANNLIGIAASTGVTEEGFLKLAKDAKSVGDILSVLGEGADSDIGKLLNRLQSEAPTAFKTLVVALRSGSKGFSEALKDAAESQDKEIKGVAKAAESLKKLQDNFELLSNSIKNVNVLFDLVSSNQLKNKSTERGFGVSSLQSRGNLASILGNEGAGNSLNIQASLRENLNGAINSQEQILNDTFQGVRDAFLGGVGNIFGANTSNAGDKGATEEQTKITKAIQDVFSGGGDIGSKINEAQKILQKSTAITKEVGNNSKNAFGKLNQDIDGLINQSNEKLTQNQRELTQINKKLAIDTINRNIERLIKATEGAFGGVSNFTDPNNNPLIKSLEESIARITSGGSNAEQQRGRFGALQSLTGLAGQPFVSDTNPDLDKVIKAYTVQLENQFSKLVGKDSALKGILDPQTIASFKKSIQDLGGFKNIAQTQILKSLGVSGGGIFNQQIKKFQTQAIKETPDSLLKALTDTTGVAQDETTVAIITQTQILAGKIDTTNRLLGGSAIGNATNNPINSAGSQVTNALQTANRRSMVPFLTTEQLNDPNGVNGINAPKAPRTGPVNPGLNTIGSISRQPADNFNSKILKQKEIEKQIQLLSSPAYQKSLIGILGKEKAFNTVRDGGGSPDVRLFEKLIEKLGLNQEPSSLNPIQQEAANNSSINISVSVAQNNEESAQLAQEIQAFVEQKYGDRIRNLERKNGVIPVPTNVPTK